MATSALSLARTRRLKNRGVQRWDAQRQGPNPSRPTAGPPCPAPPSDGAARASTTLSTGTGHARLVLLTELSTGMTAPFKQMRTHRRFVVRAWTIPSWPVMALRAALLTWALRVACSPGEALIRSCWWVPPHGPIEPTIGSTRGCSVSLEAEEPPDSARLRSPGTVAIDARPRFT